jgi:hypothetical protein
MGRASNTDVVAVAPPLIFTVERKPTAQLACVTVRFNTVVFNGMTGQPQGPPALEGWLKIKANMTKVHSIYIY